VRAAERNPGFVFFAGRDEVLRGFSVYLLQAVIAKHLQVSRIHGDVLTGLGNTDGIDGAFENRAEAGFAGLQ
jgi:hypothetical protein